MITFWTDEKVADLRKLCAGGLTASRIGAALGCSRCSVISKLKRIKMSLTQPRGWAYTNVKRSKCDPPPIPKKLFELLQCDCRFPLGGMYDPVVLFCAGTAIRGRPYCLKHAKICYHRRVA